MIRIDISQGKDIKIRTNLTPVMARVSKLMERSIKATFAAGGRPAKWLPLKKGTGRPLWGTGVLRGTLNVRSGDKWAEAGMGQGLPYAWIHHKGGMAGRGHKANIPARPYMVLQREDLDKIGKLIGAFIIQAPGGEDAVY